MPAVPEPELREALRQHFGFSAFMEGQAEAIAHTLAGDDIMLIMPTGAGKSLCYQLPSLIRGGLTIVISPLIALMKDQVDGLTARGIPATFINSSLAPAEMSERVNAMRAGRYRLVYVAPERFRNRRFLDAFNSVTLALFAVDEAHCISQWGHDFRPDYLRLRQVVDGLKHVPIMALTATATPTVRSDIIRQLGMGEGGRGEPAVLVHGFHRPNLLLAVTRASSHADKLSRVKAVLGGYRTGIIYCSTRKQTERVYALLRKAGQSCCCYHGGLSDDDRKQVQDRFMDRQVPVVAATNAFGMGVDRADLRFVIHWDIPGSIEAYYQEIGRAGRDGQEAACELLYNYADVRTQEFFLEGANPSRAEIEATWSVVRAECLHGPVTRSISDWTAAVPGVRNEMAVRTILAMLERAGLIRREMAPGQSLYATSIVEGADLAMLQEQFAALAEKRRQDLRKLKDIISYANTTRCRHTYILNYFGEHDFEPPCNACDQCGRAERRATLREPTEEEWVAIQKTLSCVARMNGRFGIGRIAQVLIGSRAKPVLERGLDKLPTHGLLKPYGQAYVRKLLDELTNDGAIRIVQGDYPLAELTERGRQVMWRKERPAVAWPDAPPAKPKAAGAPKPEPAAHVPDAAGLYPPALFENLRAWRMGVAKKRRIKPFMVMHDKTLKAVAVLCPETLADLERIHGIGPSKVAKYGDDILEIVDKWREGAARAVDTTRTR
ncbi:MAG: ATP-dependent DNA helicase RecQ [Kiritimatiellae bacterium]|nr:ATP-dependent DNA helicase RecQ [Kiritimatiellia bacterium]